MRGEARSVGTYIGLEKVLEAVVMTHFVSELNQVVWVSIHVGLEEIPEEAVMVMTCLVSELNRTLGVIIYSRLFDQSTIARKFSLYLCLLCLLPAQEETT